MRILLVFLCFIVAGYAQRPSAGAQNLNVFRLWSLMRYQNTACSGNKGEAGTCLFQDQCSARSGAVIGECASGYGKCCSFKFTCGQVTNQNETVFVNPSYPSGENGTDTCQVTIEKQPKVCQLRIDFEEFTLAQPDINGLCTTDSFMVRTTVGERLPILCGENSKQHIYIDMGRGSANPVVLSVVSNGVNDVRKWKMRINMIPCNNLDMAPSGCLQYYRSPSATIRSFNYGPKIQGRARYLSNLRYTACIRVEENFCANKWETGDSPNSFSFGAPFRNMDSANSSEPIGGTGGYCSQDDFIGIDQGSADGVGPGEDRFCGNRLLENNVIISRSKPFQLKVHSNSDQVLNAANSQQGFALRYVQLPCVI